MKFGCRVPSYAGSRISAADTRELSDYFRRVEEVGFEGLWVIDHLLVAPRVYSVAWQDPLVVLAAAAAVTERVSLGTAILVLPLRHPVMLAKQLSSIDAIAGGGRFVLGVGTGHDVDEFDAMGREKRRRGRLTDEYLAALRTLLSEESASFEGETISFKDVTFHPRPEQPIPIWVGGGSQVYIVDNPDEPTMAPAVLERIVSSNGWICRSSGTDEDIISRDVRLVKEQIQAQNRPDDDFTVSATQWVHFVEEGSREDIIAEQLKAYRTVMDSARSDDDLMKAYLFGTVEEIQQRIQRIGESGIDYLMINPLTPDPGQLDLIKKHVLEPFSS